MNEIAIRFDVLEMNFKLKLKNTENNNIGMV